VITNLFSILLIWTSSSLVPFSLLPRKLSWLVQLLVISFTLLVHVLFLLEYTSVSLVLAVVAAIVGHSSSFSCLCLCPYPFPMLSTITILDNQANTEVLDQ